MFSLHIFLLCLTGTLPNASAVINWIAASGAISGAITAGASVGIASKAGVNRRVVCEVEIENWTKFHLHSPNSWLNSGEARHPPTAIEPGTKETFLAHKVIDSATGTSGVAWWTIGDGSNAKIAVMWSCPFSFDFYSNYLAVGLSTPKGRHVNPRDWYSNMYYDGVGKGGITTSNGITFSRQQYYYETPTVTVENSRYVMSGQMGTSHITQASIIFRPQNTKDIASTLKGVVQGFEHLN